MKTIKLPWPVKANLIAVIPVLAALCAAEAQVGPSPGPQTTIPVVTIQATDPRASWSGDTGTFTVFRNGDPTMDLNIYCQVFGSATNGVDYKTLGNWVQIASGAYSNTIVVNPINLGQTNIRTVTLVLTPSPLMIPVNYIIGNPSNATVYIAPKMATNVPPVVSLVAPTNGALFYTPVDIPLVAVAGDPDGTVATVEFFAGTNSLGVVTNGPVLDPAGGTPSTTRGFLLTWSNAPAGLFTLAAKATDNCGASTLSAPVTINVRPGPPPPPPIVVSILATVPNAAEPCGTNPAVPGKFTVYRDSGTNIDLVVHYAIGGTASNGVDYVTTSNNVVISQGAFSADIVVNPLADSLAEGIETVALQLMPPICPAIYPPPPSCYGVGRSAQATVWIADCQAAPTNRPPVVRITSPANGAIFRSPVNIPLYAYAWDPDGFVASVEFFAGANSLGFGMPISAVPVSPIVIGGSISSNGTPVIRMATNTYVLVWSNVPPDSYVLTAKATDNAGVASTSAPVNITVLSPLPPPTNRPSVVTIAAIDPVAIEGTNCWPWVGLASAAPTWSNWTSATALCRYYTNCGPKNATFAVRRRGDTNEDLFVSYDIGGTAKNGVDYVPLPGSVTIPAGARQALISVVPIDDGPPDINSSVILKLQPGTNYVLGTPARAAAIILDGQGPRPVPAILPDKCFHLSASGPDGAWFRVEYSTDLIQWNAVGINQVVNGSIDFVDSDAQVSTTRFYRAMPEEGPPGE